jgi:hypothetical protein
MTESDKPATRADLEALRVDVNAQIKASEERLSERMHDIETALLRAFQHYATGVTAQFQRLNVSDQTTEVRLSALESRVLDLETRPRS